MIFKSHASNGFKANFWAWWHFSVVLGKHLLCQPCSPLLVETSHSLTVMIAYLAFSLQQGQSQLLPSCCARFLWSWWGGQPSVSSKNCHSFLAHYASRAQICHTVTGCAEWSSVSERWECMNWLGPRDWVLDLWQDKSSKCVWSL